MGANLNGVLELVHEVESATTVDEFVEASLCHLARLIPCDEIGFEDLDVHSHEIPYRSTDGAAGDEDHERWFWAHHIELPICVAVPPGRAGVGRMSDVVDPFRLRSSEAFSVHSRPLGSRLDMKMGFAAPNGYNRAFVLDRSDRDSRTASATSRCWCSRREVEVLRLVAEGLTNREIGARLFISPETVRKHLNNAFPKLGVRTRLAAAAALG